MSQALGLLTNMRLLVDVCLLARIFDALKFRGMAFKSVSLNNVWTGRLTAYWSHALLIFARYSYCNLIFGGLLNPR